MAIKKIYAHWKTLCFMTICLVVTTFPIMSFAGRVESIPIIGTSLEWNEKAIIKKKDPEPAIEYIVISFEKRPDSNGLIVLFKNKPGKFDDLIQNDIQYAIRNAARAMHKEKEMESWTVELIVPIKNFTVYGTSCSAEISLVVLAMAEGRIIPPDRVITGKITPDGLIGSVGEISTKLFAASKKHFRKVLVPFDEGPDIEPPFLMHVKKVQTVREAYEELFDALPTDHP